MPNDNLKKVAAVTGASSGIGAVYADRLARDGYDLVLIARRGDRLKTLAESIGASYGGDVEVVVANLASETDLAHVEDVLRMNPRVEMLVNNAGIARLAPFGIAPLRDALNQIALNVTALTRLTQAVLPAFLERDRGAIINISSVLSIESLPDSAVYSGTKGFVTNFSRGLQAELKGTNVRVQLVLPGMTATEVWDKSGVPLETLDASTVMSTEDLVDAALAAFAKEEDITWPSVADVQLWERFDAARSALFAASRSGRPAPRYALL